MKYLDVLLFFTSLSLSAQVFDYDQTGKITVKVVDEKKQPLEGIDVGVGFEHLKTSNAWGTRTGTAVNGKTDKDGIFIAESKGLNGVGISAKKEGYYNSYVDYSFKSSENGKYQPWNPTIQLTLRKIVNPVPMYAKRNHSISLPSLGESVGYDFLVGDWVAPHGKGKVSDLVFLFKLDYEKEVTDPNFGKMRSYGYRVEMTMPNRSDGFCPIPNDNIFPESDFKLPYEAPEEGYVDKLVFERDSVKNIKTLAPDADNFYIRIRTELDENGNVKRGYYGKFLFSDRLNRIVYTNRSGGECDVIFAYYINPDYTRNIEFDSKRNLFIPPGKENLRIYSDYTNITP